MAMFVVAAQRGEVTCLGYVVEPIIFDAGVQTMLLVCTRAPSWLLIWLLYSR